MPLGLTFEYAGHDLDGVGFPALAHIAALSWPAAVQPLLDVGFDKGDPWRGPVDDAADGRAMALTPSGDAK